MRWSKHNDKTNGDVVRPILPLLGIETTHSVGRHRPSVRAAVYTAVTAALMDAFVFAPSGPISSELSAFRALSATRALRPVSCVVVARSKTVHRRRLERNIKHLAYSSSASAGDVQTMSDNEYSGFLLETTHDTLWLFMFVPAVWHLGI